MPSRSHIPEAGSVAWCTPQYIVNAVRNTFEGTIDLDPCSNDSSIVGAIAEFKLPHTNGLTADWTPYRFTFLNPPYGKTYLHTPTMTAYSVKEFRDLDAQIKSECTKSSIYDWIKKAVEATNRLTHKNTILLIPAAVDTKAWQEIIFKLRAYEKARICFLKSRVKFIGATNSAPMAVAAVMMYDTPDYVSSFTENFGRIGTVI